MWDEIDIKKKTYFYFKFFLMKKIILLVIALVWLSGFGFADTWLCTEELYNEKWNVVDGWFPLTTANVLYSLCEQTWKTKIGIQFYKGCCPDWSTVYENELVVRLEVSLMIIIKNVVHLEVRFMIIKKCCNWQL